MITFDEVVELVVYDADTGAVTWRPRRQEWFSAGRYCHVWNGRYAGREAGTAFLNRGKPYRAVTILGKRYLLHRLIWLYMTGSWPTELDHIDGDGTNNAWLNLREVSHGDNSRNQKLRCNNKSGVPGVMYESRRQSWRADIRVNYVRHYLGNFSDKFEAVCARKSAEVTYEFHENHGQRP